MSLLWKAVAVTYLVNDSMPLPSRAETSRDQIESVVPTRKEQGGTAMPHLILISNQQRFHAHFQTVDFLV